MKKKKILLLSDHALSTSGVGVQSRFLCMGLIEKGRWSIRQLGGAIKHGDYRVMKVNDDLIIKPVDGFGNPDQLKLLLATEKPDVLMLFTDPRFFSWIFEMEEEVHQICPIVYNHLWDNGPAPEFNRVIYESTDLINCINYPTYRFCKKRWPEKTNYIPHAVPSVFVPLPEADIVRFKHEFLNGKCDDHFVAAWVNRNARRKQPSDLLAGWKKFLAWLEKKYGHKKASLVMHTNPTDKEGTNLFAVVDMLDIKDNVIFSTGQLEFEQMNVVYNVADTVINVSSAEGFGLSTLEAMQAGTPIIAHKTGGLTRQVINHKTNYVHGVALDTDVKSLVGSQSVPYIYDDYISSDTIAAGLIEMYEFGPEKRKEIGYKAREYALSEYSMNSMINTWDKTLWDVTERWRNERETVYKPWEMRTL